MKARKVAALTAVAGVTLTLGAVSCSYATPSIGECGVVTGRGIGDNQTIKKVVQPGAKVHKGTREEDWYLPCNVRNYFTGGDDPDRANSMVLRTAAGKDGTPGMPIYVDSQSIFQLFQTKDALKKFFPFCLKYSCADPSPADKDSAAERSGRNKASSPGWQAMLREVYGKALDNATKDALATGKWGPDLWRKNDEWQALGAEISKNFNKELSVFTGTTSPFFCAPSADIQKCYAPQVYVSQVRPQSSTIEDQYNQQVAAENAKAANTARRKAAGLLYGSKTDETLELLDLVNACKAAKVACNLYVGGQPLR
jgi:hypothetical protein